MNKTSIRTPALDVIRCIALFCVIGVHFFLNTDFYDCIISGYPMLIMTIMRNSFMICVPLFMMLTGYLIHRTDADKFYYGKIIRIIFTYVMASIVCGVYKVYFHSDDLSVLGAIANIFTFETAPYSWYIEMYIGLFLLIPFMNTLYEGLDIGKKKILIVSLLVLTALPSVFNIYCIRGLAWWIKPSTASNYFPIVPDWWTNIYPITYFFLGKYIKEFPIRLNTKLIGSLIIIISLFAGAFNFYRSYGSQFIWGPWQEYGSFFITVQATLLFVFCIKIKFTHMPPVIERLVAKISNLSLGAYLTSWLFDQLIYSRLNASVQTMQEKLVWFPIVVTLVLTGSLLCSWLIDLFYSLALSIITNLHIISSRR